MAFKVFTSAVLTAADVNDYLAEQAVIVCTSATRPTAQAGMTIYESDTFRVLNYDGTGWVILAEPAQTWSPTFVSGVTVGNGTWSAYTKRGDGWVDLEATFTLGTTSAITGDILLNLPYTRNMNVRTLSLAASFYDASGSVDVPAVACVSGNATNVYLRAFNCASTYAGATVCSASIPFTWATSDLIYVTGRYRMTTRYT